SARERKRQLPPTWFNSRSRSIALWSGWTGGWFSLRGRRGPDRAWGWRLADHHLLVDVGKELATDDAIRRPQCERVFVDRLDGQRRRRCQAVARDPILLDDPSASRAGPLSLTEATFGVEVPRPNLLGLRIPTDPLRPASVRFSSDLNRILANQEL